MTVINNIAAIGILVWPRALGRLLVDSDVVVVRFVGVLDVDISVRDFPVTICVGTGRWLRYRCLGRSLRLIRLSGSICALGGSIQSAVIGGGRCGVKPSQIKTIFTSSISADALRVGSAGVVMALRGSVQAVLEGLGGLDDSGHETSLDVPLDVAVEHPDTWVIGAEADDGVAVVLDHDGVASDRGVGDVAR